MELRPVLHPAHATIQVRHAAAGSKTVSAPAPSTRQLKRNPTVQVHAASVEKIPEDDRPNDHPFPHSLVLRVKF